MPKYRSAGKALVVCKSNSQRRIERQLKGNARRRNLALLERCRFNHIQAAVDAARSGNRILILPGVYREEPSRRVPEPNRRCKANYEEYQDPGFGATGIVRVANYAYQRKCPNAQNLIAIVGVMQFWVPSAFRGSDPTGQSENSGPAYDAQTDTSNGNRMQANVMGVGRGGKRDPNGKDFWWDEEGSENCWSANQAGAGNAITSNPVMLPD